MPELPEVETTRLGILPWICHRPIENVVIRQPKLRYNLPDNLAVLLKDDCFLDIKRRAKYLLLEGQKQTYVAHLGMSGSFRIETPESAIRKHDHLIIVFSEQIYLHYHDPRRFGFFVLLNDNMRQRLEALGPEPLSGDFNAEYLYQLSRGKKTAVKPWIMQQSVVVGVGNIYACEALFASQISPFRSVGDLTFGEMDSLVSQIKGILHSAILQGGTTLRDFVNAEGNTGYFQQTLKVYGREKQVCSMCNQPVERKVQAQRSTFYCAFCQK